MPLFWWFIIPSALSALGAFFQGRGAGAAARTQEQAAGQAGEISERRYQDALGFERERIADEKARWNQVLGMTERAYQDMTPYRQVGQGAIMTLGALTGTGPGQPARGSVLLQRGRRLGPGSPRTGRTGGLDSRLITPVREPGYPESPGPRLPEWPRPDSRIPPEAGGQYFPGGYISAPDGRQIFVPGYRYRTEDEYRRRGSAQTFGRTF